MRRFMLRWNAGFMVDEVNVGLFYIYILLTRKVGCEIFVRNSLVKKML